jgi:hypothetical protein
MTTLSTLLRTTAQRYQAAAQAVLATWTPECGCVRPGISATCEGCPSLAIFRQRISQKIVEAAPPTKEKAARSTDYSIIDYSSTTQSMETPYYDPPSAATAPLQSPPPTHPSKQPRSSNRKRSAAKRA